MTHRSETREYGKRRKHYVQSLTKRVVKHT